VRLSTIGHGLLSAGRLAELLRAAGVVELVDVRTAPRSSRNRDVQREAMARWLPDQGVGYRWERRLGGWRPDVPGAPDTAVPHRALVGYAVHMRSPAFRAAVDELLAASAPTAVLCSEADWRHCHRRMLADFVVLARGVPVVHLLPDGGTEAHVPSPGARLRDDGLLVYDGGQPSLPGLEGTSGPPRTSEG
jgi:uncharacterized protein (DUF488 family)